MRRSTPSPFGPTAAIGMFIGGAVLAGSMVIKSGLTDTATQLAGIQTSLAETKVALDAVAKSGGGAAPAAAPRRGPDPNKVYTVKTAGAPIKGPAEAKITLVEFSDFQ
jgi:protein-disulfide isomerase